MLRIIFFVFPFMFLQKKRSAEEIPATQEASLGEVFYSSIQLFYLSTN